MLSESIVKNVEYNRRFRILHGYRKTKILLDYKNGAGKRGIRYVAGG